MSKFQYTKLLLEGLTGILSRNSEFQLQSLHPDEIPCPFVVIGNFSI